MSVEVIAATQYSTYLQRQLLERYHETHQPLLSTTCYTDGNAELAMSTSKRVQLTGEYVRARSRQVEPQQAMPQQARAMTDIHPTNRLRGILSSPSPSAISLLEDFGRSIVCTGSEQVLHKSRLSVHIPNKSTHYQISIEHGM